MLQCAKFTLKWVVGINDVSTLTREKRIEICCTQHKFQPSIECIKWKNTFQICFFSGRNKCAFLFCLFMCIACRRSNVFEHLSTRIYLNLSPFLLSLFHHGSFSYFVSIAFHHALSNSMIARTEDEAKGEKERANWVHWFEPNNIELEEHISFVFVGLFSLSRHKDSARQS